MSFHYPRRVKDLPTLEPDSEDDFNTPQKNVNHKKRNDAQLEAISQANKENDSSSTAMGSSTKTNNTLSNLRMYPKRSAELPALESDSEEEDNAKNDNLNCAILNDSFILDESNSSSKHFGESSAVKAKKPIDDEAANGNLSFVLRFDKMDLEEKKQSPRQRMNSETDIQIAEPMKSTAGVCILQSIVENNEVQSNIAAAPNAQAEYIIEQQTLAKAKALETPLRPCADVDKQSTTTQESLAAQQAETQFVTPQVRSFSMQRRPRDLCSTQSQKSRAALVNEFRSQKVLFQTPMAITRAPISRLTNDSITLSLCDTINETADTPNTAEKTPQRSEKNDAVPEAKSKKSLENAFKETKEHEAKDTAEAAAVSKAGANVNVTPAAAAGRDTILKINNNEYIIQKKLGCGGSSSVYLAQSTHNSSEYALKVVDLHGDPTVVEGYLNETKLLAKLQGNVCVVALYEYQLLRKESKLFLVMEKGDSDLHKILQGYNTNLPLYVLMNFLYQMLQAVNYIHQNGVIHSDLKPANFLMVNGRLKLIDFGIASNIAIDSTSIIKFSQAGTFNYISPEALTDTSTGTSPMRNNQPKIKISTKSDVWSLGCILYLLLYKKTPFSDIKNIYAKISAISSPSHVIAYPGIPPYYPAMLVHIAKNCLQHNPKKRPSCAEILQLPFNMVIPIHNLAVPTKQT